ncbi:pentapeptide repeat-containing protein [Anabaena cylindrica FACHB-243]|uniref:Pentapeptide repeat protein n=1 Tax=Anabaena cylindrica (strain ATCC 27899 / PCC 7122) TaxID=272123 RepID=K9ZST8_ANACC|nr:MULTISPECIES: pentapeptide repeat-containing protein [Anabaena]AFZ61440.1 pentapeptide repeat protein [Anabaena cylindrica PCC 7122]MBD2421545.1 pentapeptide repeat-containing protein [Anabaena cylindrica FACHB-243]MBY5284244.1 pentapeptide repeat-containing protein [Anabaena sp. CCAP 1446/1C]MBY5310615.1 pentapeptide repeat-containing protein [Anabaena sp. CCAP 1446/1C]MCM2405960.1 pentapeptide repeat-containing protein [Anabaena sp. CCAP 1446/1C]
MPDNREVNDNKNSFNYWLIASIYIAIFLLVSALVFGFIKFISYESTPENFIKNESEALKTVATIFGGIAIIINAIFAARRADAMEESAKAALENAQIAEDKQITERFSKAIEQLASEKIEVRLGGIYTLERIAKDSEKDHRTVMEVLTAFIRENAPEKIQNKAQKNNPLIDEWLNIKKVKELNKLPKLCLDIQECLTVIARHKHTNLEDKRLNLSNINISQANLNRAKLTEAILSEAILSEAILSEAILIGADLTNATLYKTNLTQAKLIEANLYKADLTRAYLEKADLTRAYLEETNLTNATLTNATLFETDLNGANLSNTNLYKAQLIEATLSEAILTGANLTKAILTNAMLDSAMLDSAILADAFLLNANLTEANLARANLTGADFTGADLTGATLIKANLTGADFARAKGLTSEQIQLAIGDEKTILPENIERPKHWKSS